MSTDYNIIYVTSAAEFQISNTTSADDIGIVFSPNSGLYVDTSATTNALLLASATNSITSANADLNVAVTSATTDSTANPTNEINIGEESELKLQIVIKLLSPIVITGYDKTAKLNIDKEAIVKRHK